MAGIAGLATGLAFGFWLPLWGALILLPIVIIQALINGFISRSMLRDIIKPPKSN